MTTHRADAPASPRLGRYEIDTRASTVTFATRHVFGLLPVRGTFAIKAGTINIVEPISDSTAHVEIDAASFHTGNPLRDRVVRSATYLDTGRHPVMTFASSAWDGQTLAGALTVRDATRPVALTVDDSSVRADMFTVHATTRIDRTAFGVTAGRGMTGRYLTLTLEIRCVRT